MKFFLSLLLGIFSSSAVHAAWVLPVEKLTCTADLNDWGKSGTCACPESNAYNEKLGQCMTGDPYPIMVSGVLNSKDAEKKGVTIKTQIGTFKVIVKTAELKRLQNANGLYFEVEGEFVLLQGKPLIVAERLSWLE